MKERLQQTLDTSSNLNRNLGLAFITVMIFISTTIFSVSDKMLLISKELIRIPILNIDLPLVPYFMVIPIVFLGIHLNFLINLLEHSKTYFHWFDMLDEDEKRHADTCSHPFLLNYVLIHRRKNSFSHLLMRLVVELVVFYLPLGLLHFIQLRFSDYQDFSKTWWHYSFFILDWMMVFYFRAKIYDHQNYLALKQNFFSLHWKDGLFSFYRFIPHYFRKQIPNIPIPKSSWISFLLGIVFFFFPFVNGAVNCLVVFKLTSHHYWSIKPYISSNFEIDPSEFSNTQYQVIRVIRALVYRPILEVKEEKLFGNDPLDEMGPKDSPSDSLLQALRLKHAEGLYLRGRSLRLCNLSDSQLFNVHLEGTLLEGGIMERTVFDGAHLDSSKFDKAMMYGSSLRKVVGSSIKKIETDFFSNVEDARSYPSFNGADLSRAQLQDADLRKVDFQNAKLERANLQNANLKYSNFKGGVLVGAQFQNAWLQNAQFQAADMRSASFNGADLSNANFDFANLGFAKFTGANLYYTDFCGSKLGYANLQGTKIINGFFQKANLTSANFNGAFLSRVSFSRADLTNTLLDSIYYENSPIYDWDTTWVDRVASLNNSIAQTEFIELMNNQEGLPQIKIGTPNLEGFIAFRKLMLLNSKNWLFLRDLMLWKKNEDWLLQDKQSAINGALLNFAKKFAPEKVVWINPKKKSAAFELLSNPD